MYEYAGVCVWQGFGSSHTQTHTQTHTHTAIWLIQRVDDPDVRRLLSCSLVVLMAAFAVRGLNQIRLHLAVVSNPD